MPAKKSSATKQPKPFTLTELNCEAVSINLRKEKHGKDKKVPAFDMIVMFSGSNETLRVFGDALVDMLYTDQAPGADAQTKELAGMDKLDSPRYRDIAKPIELKREVTGAIVRFSSGGKVLLKLDDCKVNVFKVMPRDAGYCEMTFRIQSTFDLKQSAQIVRLWAGGEFKVTVEGPQAELFNEDDDAHADDKSVPLFGKRKGEDRPTAH